MQSKNQGGFTLTELVVGLTILAIVALSILGLFTSLVNSSVVAQRKAVAAGLATNQMEYLKSLPYDSLAIAGGSIYSPDPLPATITKKVNGVNYVITSSINYVDDAYDGCTNYPNEQLKQLYCRNYPPPSGAPATDTNPQDYKVAHVSVTLPNGRQLATVDTHISARVAETASSTGALFVKVVDSTGNPVSGATIQVVNSVVGPVDVSDNTDSNGIAVFYGLPPDTSGYHYNITASKSGYSTLTTIPPAGALQPSYPNQNILIQQSSFVTMTIMLQGTDSLVIEATDTDGDPLSDVSIYVKGGYKKYTDTSDTSYYFDNLSPSDSRPATDASGLTSLSNLVPGTYIFCGDNGSSSCSDGGTTYYLVAALPYAGSNSFNPITVPIYDPANPPAVTFPYGSGSFLQKVRLILTTSLSHPRVFTLSPDETSLSSGDLSNFTFQVTGANLPCSSNPASCSTDISFIQGSETYTASCSGTSGADLDCTVDLTGITSGNAQLRVAANGYSLTMPASPLMGGLRVIP